MTIVPDSSAPHSSGDLDLTRGLVCRAQGGDNEALEKLFARYLPRTVRIVSLRMGKKLAEFVEYEDVAQEALLKVFRDLEQFEVASEASFRNWVALIVEREIGMLDRRRTAQKRGGGKVRRFGDFALSGTLSGALGSDTPTPSEVVTKREVEDQMEQAILQLKPHQRELIIQRYVCEMSYAEIARSIGLDESTVRGSCRVAEKRLGALLAGASRAPG